MRFSAWLACVAMTGPVLACGSDDDGGGGKGGTGATSGSGGSGGSGGSSASGGSGGSSASGGSGGTAGSSGSGGSSGGSGGSAGLQNCFDCVGSQCAAELDTCHADPDCDAILSVCVPGCSGDQACIDKCVTDNPNGATKFQAIGTCADTKCATECA